MNSIYFNAVFVRSKTTTCKICIPFFLQMIVKFKVYLICFGFLHRFFQRPLKFKCIKNIVKYFEPNVKQNINEYEYENAINHRIWVNVLIGYELYDDRCCFDVCCLPSLAWLDGWQSARRRKSNDLLATVEHQRRESFCVDVYFFSVYEDG